MTELVLTKTPAGSLAPADERSAKFIATLKIGAGVRGDFKRLRNVRFHRKAFALLGFAFDMWDAPELEYRGQPVQKSFDRFRKDLTVLAGHYTAVSNIRGEVRLEAESLSFASMDEDRFSAVYQSILSVVWDRVLKAKGYESPAAVDAIVERLLGFE